jgi:hypothetical protein
MPKSISEQNKTIVLKAFDTLFNQRDYAADSSTSSRLHRRRLSMSQE